MHWPTYMFTFSPSIDLDEAQASLVLAEMATESLHGPVKFMLEGHHHFDRRRRACFVDGSNAVGRDLAKLLTGFLAREFNESAFQVERIESQTVPGVFNGVE